MAPKEVEEEEEEEEGSECSLIDAKSRQEGGRKGQKKINKADNLEKWAWNLFFWEK